MSNHRTTIYQYAIWSLARWLQEKDLQLLKLSSQQDWLKKDIINLLDSVYHGYPIGNILIARPKGPVSISYVDDLSITEREFEQSYTRYVLDGKQRLITLCSIITDLDHSRIEDIYFDMKNGTFIYPVADPQPHLFPLTEVHKISNKGISKYFDYTYENMQYFGEVLRLSHLIADYAITVIEIAEIEPEEVVPIINRMRAPGNTARLTDRPTLFVEGKTDVTILRRAIQIFNPQLYANLHILSDKSAGYNWIKDCLMAWVMMRNESPAAGLFDEDEDALRAKAMLDEFLGGRINHHVRSFRLAKESPYHIRKILKQGIRIPIALEEMLPISIWKQAKEKDWLETRDDIIRYNRFFDFDKTFRQYCLEKGVSEEDLLYILHRVKLGKKQAISKYVSTLQPSEIEEALDGFRPLVTRLASHFL